MRLASAILLLAAAVGASAAGTPAEEALRVQIEVLQNQVAPLKVATAAPLLPGQLSDLMTLLSDLAGADATRVEAAGRLKLRAAFLQDALRRQAASSRPTPGFYRGVAAQVKALAADAAALIAPADAAVPGLPPAPTRGAAQVQADLAQSRARIASTLAGAGAFDGAAAPPVPDSPPVVAAAPAAAIPPLLARSRSSARRYDGDVALLQTALSVVRREEGLRRVRADGLFGAGTETAVADFQARAGLAKTGALDAATQVALLSRFQSLKGLPTTGALDADTSRALAAASRSRRGANPGRYFLGSAADFDATDGQAVIPGALATVYTPFIARSAADQKREGPPHDRFMQTICTLERYVAGSCPYVSVAIDSRLNVPDGTPLRIPEIDAVAGRPVLFRITDTGSQRLFHGTGHVDIATDSTQYHGFGSQISGRQLTLVLPQGLHPVQP